MAELSDCWTCEFLDLYDAALDGADQTLFGALESPIVAVLAGAATVMFLFATQIRAAVKTFAPEMEQQRWFMDMWAQSGRFVLVSLAITSYTFWHDWVVGSINTAIGTVAAAVIGASKLRQGGAPGADIFNLATPNDFSSLMEVVYQRTFAPLDQVMQGYEAVSFGVSDVPIAIAITLSIFVVRIFAAFSVLMFFLILAMHKTMTVFVVGMGPLIMALWIFDGTRPYAKSMVRFLLATGSIVIGAAFLVGLALAVVDASVANATYQVIDGKPYYDVETLQTWVMSAKFTAFLGSYMGLFFMMIIAVLVGLATVLMQRPQLER